MNQKKHINEAETQLGVSCPSWLRKRILRNLQRSSLNRFNRTRTDKTRELLVAINAKPNNVASQTQSNPDIIKASVDTNKAASHSAQTATSEYVYLSATRLKNV
jgi:hypothetical protein